MHDTTWARFQQCPFWDDWSEWTPCSFPCGGGERRRERRCRNGYIGQVGCSGEGFEEEECNQVVSKLKDCFFSFRSF